MLDIKFVRANPDAVKENIKKKFQDEKLVLVDEVLEFDQQYREAKTKADSLRGERKALSKQIGGLMAQGKKDEAEEVKARAAAMGEEMEKLEALETELEAKIKERMMVIPQMIDPSVPIGKDDSENVEVRRWGEPTQFDFEPKPHWDLGQALGWFDWDAAARVTGSRFCTDC